MQDLLPTEASIEAALQPTSAVVQQYMHPLDDDTWVRHAELVNVAQLKDANGTTTTTMKTTSGREVVDARRSSTSSNGNVASATSYNHSRNNNNNSYGASSTQGGSSLRNMVLKGGSATTYGGSLHDANGYTHHHYHNNNNNSVSSSSSGSNAACSAANALQELERQDAIIQQYKRRQLQTDMAKSASYKASMLQAFRERQQTTRRTPQPQQQ